MRPEFIFEHVCADTETHYHRCANGDQYWWPKESQDALPPAQPLGPEWEDIGFVEG